MRGAGDTPARMTVSLPADLYAEVEDRIGRSGAGNRSRFVADALRTHLNQLRHQDMTAEAARLDPDEELEWAITMPPPPDGAPPTKPGT
jgi:Arc/MetJ-type ribon-helix-helix transcriptional regulator